MQATFSNESIIQLRASNLDSLVGLRLRDRDALLKQRRLSLCEVEALFTNISLQQFKELVMKVKQKKATIETLKAIKNNCCTASRSEAFFRVDGALDSLIRILIGKDAQMQLEAVACLTNLACGSHKASHRIAKAAGPYYVTFISSGSCYLQDQCSWAAGNVANDCFECFSLLKSQGLVPALLTILESSSSNVVQSAVFALNACTKYGDLDLKELIGPDIISSLLKIVNNKDFSNNTHSDAAFVLSNICYLSNMANSEVTTSNLESILTLLCKVITPLEINMLVALPLIRCLGFMSKDISVCSYLSQSASFFQLVKQVLNSKCHSLRKETLWLLSNMSVHEGINEEMIDINLLSKTLAVNKSPVDVCLQELYYLCTLVSRSEKAYSLIQHKEFIAKIYSFLNCGETAIENAAKIFFSIVYNKISPFYVPPFLL